MYFTSPHLIYPLTARVVGAPQMTSQPVPSVFLCSPPPAGTWRTPGLSISWCCLRTSSSVCLFFFPLSLCPASCFGQIWWMGDMSIPLQFASLYDGHEVFVWSQCLLDLGMDFFVGNMIFVWDAKYLAVAPHLHCLYSFFEALLWGSMIHKNTGWWMWQGSISVVPWNWEKCSCHSKLVSTLPMLLLSVLSWRVSQARQL